MLFRSYCSLSNTTLPHQPFEKERGCQKRRFYEAGTLLREDLPCDLIHVSGSHGENKTLFIRLILEKRDHVLEIGKEKSAFPFASRRRARSALEMPLLFPVSRASYTSGRSTSAASLKERANSFANTFVLEY